MSETNLSGLDAKIAPDATIEAMRGGAALLLVHLAVTLVRLSAAMVIAMPVALLAWLMIR